MDTYGNSWRYPLQRQHSVKNPIIVNDDIEIQRRMFWEGAISTGVIVDFYRCISDVSDFYQDPHLEYEEPIRLPIIFDDHPKLKILKMYGWFTEDEEHPTLAYLPMYKEWQTKELLDVRENSLMRVSYYGQPYPADFRIMDKKLDSIYGVYWICKLAPERINQFTVINNHGEHFLKKVREGRDTTNDYTRKNGSDVDNRVYAEEGYTDILTEQDDGESYFDKIVKSSQKEDTVIRYDNTKVNKPDEPKDTVSPYKKEDIHEVSVKDGLYTYGFKKNK